MKHGFVFGEHIRTEKLSKRRYDDTPQQPLRSRGFLLLVVLIVVTVLLLGRLFFLQLLHGSDYRKLADSNRIRTQTIHAPRGIIFDRNGIPLVFNLPGFREVKKEKKTVHLTKEEALARIAKGDQTVEVDSLRQYPYKEATGHVLGYIGQISEEELQSEKFAAYGGSDWLGKSGIERQYEELLRGQDGKQLLEVDALGRKVRPLGQTDPIAGQDITLTLDATLQQKVYAATTTITKGAVLVSTPDGQILAMVSKPSFDPNLFTLDQTYKPASDAAYTSLSSILLDGQNHPLLDRAIAGTYPPGSTFKLITAATGLENRIIDGNYRVTDTGILKVGEFSYANWYFTKYGKTDGEVDVVKALSRSNDIFFYKLAEKVGVDTLSATARAFGLGQKLGIDLGGEAGGIVPSKAWKKEALEESWYLGDTYHYGIGQGYLLTTPLQVNSFTQVVANGGTLYQPHLLKNQKSKIKNQKLLNGKTISLIRQGMLDSCSKGGVAWPLFDFTVKNKDLKIDGKNILQAASQSAEFRKVTIACKTGTAQHGGEDTLPHAWITLFAPAYNPEIVVTVLSESSGEGSNEAAPVAKKVLEAWFGK